MSREAVSVNLEMALWSFRGSSSCRSSSGSSGGDNSNGAGGSEKENLLLFHKKFESIKVAVAKMPVAAVVAPVMAYGSGGGGGIGCFLKNVLHKREEKIQEKMKMTLQKDKSWVQGQQH